MQTLVSCPDIVGGLYPDAGAELTEVNGKAHRVHPLLQYPPTVQRSRLVNSLQGVSSRVLRRDHPVQVRQMLWGEHSWSPSCSTGSRDGALLSVMAEYIEHQKHPG